MAKLISKKEITKIEPIVYGNKDTVMFIVSYTDGWAVLSGDKRAVPVLGSSEKGSFNSEISSAGSAIWFNEAANGILELKKKNLPIDEKSLTENKDFNFWIKAEKASNVQKALSSKPKEPPTINFVPLEETYLCKRLISSHLVSNLKNYVGPYTRTEWGQREPWNTNLPQVWSYKLNSNTQPPTGCVAVAIAQMLYFTHYKLGVPSGLYHTVYSTGQIYDETNYSVSFYRGNYQENSPRWDQMPLEYQEDDPNTSYVADLMADVGNRVNMKYAVNGSSSSLSLSAFQSYGLMFDEKDYNSTDVLNNLRNGMPVMISAMMTASTTGWWFWEQTHYKDGHAWIIDGIVDNTRRIGYEYVWELAVVRGNSNTSESDQEPQVISTTTTLDDLNAEYDEVVPYIEATNRGIYPDRYDIEIYPYTTSNIVMNWGADGLYNHKEYSPCVSSFSPNGTDIYQYIPTIYYNIRKM